MSDKNNKASNAIKYSKRIVAYIDILGFRELIKDPEMLEALVEAINILRFESKVESYSKYINIEAKQFSDCVLIWSDVKSFKETVIFISKIGFMISNLHARGILTRGAISYGDHYYKDDILISPAFIDAYKYESSIAKYPRVIFTPSFCLKIEEIIKADKEPEKIRKDWGLFTQVDSDGYIFLHYLSFLHFHIDKENPNAASQIESSKHLKLLVKHKRLIENRINMKDESIKSKFIWLANYFNKFIDFGAAIHPDKKADYKISESLLKI